MTRTIKALAVVNRGTLVRNHGHDKGRALVYIGTRKRDIEEACCWDGDSVVRATITYETEPKRGKARP